MNERGGQLRDNEIIAENRISGWSTKIISFKKLGCQAANAGSGYLCNYKAKTEIESFSNEGSAAGDKHADSVNAILQMLGGSNISVVTETRRFMKSGIEWIVSDN